MSVGLTCSCMSARSYFRAFCVNKCIKSQICKSHHTPAPVANSYHCGAERPSYQRLMKQSSPIERKSYSYAHVCLCMHAGCQRCSSSCNRISLGADKDGLSLPEKTWSCPPFHSIAGYSGQRSSRKITASTVLKDLLMPPPSRGCCLVDNSPSQLCSCDY